MSLKQQNVNAKLKGKKGEHMDSTENSKKVWQSNTEPFWDEKLGISLGEWQSMRSLVRWSELENKQDFESEEYFRKFQARVMSAIEELDSSQNKE